MPTSNTPGTSIIPDAASGKSVAHGRETKDPDKCKAGFPHDEGLTDELIQSSTIKDWSIFSLKIRLLCRRMRLGLAQSKMESVSLDPFRHRFLANALVEGG